MKDKDEILCHCMDVTYGTVMKAIEDGAQTVEEVGEQTDAGIVCGACIEEIEELLEKE